MTVMHPDIDFGAHKDAYFMELRKDKE